MKYFMPDSNDVIDPTFDPVTESRSPDLLARDKLYCHEVLPRPYNGMLISYTAVTHGRYSAAARRRLLRSGAHEFFRSPTWIEVMGDCGAFSYIGEDVPPYTVNEVADFYTQAQVNYGLAVDHIVPGFTLDNGATPTPEALRRYELTLALAADFLCAAKGRAFEPVGVVQGYSPESFARAAAHLQKLGYTYLALGGLVRLKNAEIVAILEAVNERRDAATRVHLLGVARPGQAQIFSDLGVSSFDSTSPLRRAWMDGRKNYWLGNETFCALRIPPSTSPRIRDYPPAINLEARALERVAAYADRRCDLSEALEALLGYGKLHSPNEDRTRDYTATLTARPWERCSCAVCKRLGHHVVLLRGAERNRPRGFHNVAQFYTGMLHELGEPVLVLVGCGSAKRDVPTCAGDMYTGSLFRAHRKIADSYRAPMMILSAKHGVISSRQVIEPYNSVLTTDTVTVWERAVLEQLAWLPEGSRVVALAGKRYLGWTDRLSGVNVEQPLAGKTLGARLAIAAAM